MINPQFTVKHWDVLGIGTAAVDDLLYLDRFPHPDSKVPVREAHRQGGGLTATALVAAARLGAKAAYCGLLGEDELSVFTERELEREGVDCSLCVRSEGGRPFHSVILVEREGNTRTILYQPGTIEPPLEAITADLVASCRVLFIDHNAPNAGLRAARLAHQTGVPVVADIEVAEFAGLDEFLALADHLIVGQSLAARLCGQMEPEEQTAMLARSGRACTVITAGERGCWYSLRGGPVLHQPAFRVQVVDTTGCGDVFHGVYAAALAQGEGIPGAIRLASAAAAIKATRPGGRAGIPDRAAVERFIGEYR